MLLATWPSLRPARTATRFAPVAASPLTPDVPLATLTLSLLTFNAIFAVENALDLAFLWSGAPLPDGVTLSAAALAAPDAAPAAVPAAETTAALTPGAFSLARSAACVGAFADSPVARGSESSRSPLESMRDDSTGGSNARQTDCRGVVGAAGGWRQAAVQKRPCIARLCDVTRTY